MEVKDIVREKFLLEAMVERDNSILALFQEKQRLIKELEQVRLENEALKKERSDMGKAKKEQ